MFEVRKKRRSRIHRCSEPRPIELTKRRIEGMKLLYRHRLATTDVFQAVLEGSDRRIQEELRDVWDNGYIDRPMEQWIMHRKYKGGRGRSEIIYALSNKGMQFLEQNFGYNKPKTNLDKKNRELGETTIFHDVTLTRFWANLKAALDQRRSRTGQDFELLSWYQDRPDREYLKTEITLRNGQSVNIIPDAAFKMRCPMSQYLFFVEYYRTRKGGNQIYLNKLKLYNHYFHQGQFKKYGVKKGFRVLSIVPSRTVASNLINLINTKDENAELRQIRFWFASEQHYWIYIKERVRENTYRKIKDVESILEPIFRTPIDDEWHSLDD